MIVNCSCQTDTALVKPEKFISEFKNSSYFTHKLKMLIGNVLL